MIKDILARNEGKYLEFKENCRSMQNILRTVVAFANTSGGTLVLGVRDNTNEVVGLTDPLADEERLANAFADNISPVLVPDIQIVSWRDRELIVINVPHLVGPYYIRSEGPENGVYIRLGSTNRLAGPEIIAGIQRLAVNTLYDEQPCTEVNSEDIDFRAASEFFSQVSRKLGTSKRKSLGLLVPHNNREFPSRGAVLLFGKQRNTVFPDAIIRCARFRGTTTEQFLDQTDIDEYLPRAIESTVEFIERHTLRAAQIGRVRREEIPQYPPAAVREAVINAVVHADYSLLGMNIRIGIFDDRLEITSPGMLPFGLTLEAALSGVSKLRNRVIGRVFRELGLIEQWGSGMGRMIAACTDAGFEAPNFEEIGTTFRVTLFARRPAVPTKIPEWRKQLEQYLLEHHEISTRGAAQLWDVSDRTARTRLRKLVIEGVLAEIGTGPQDPKRVYVPKSKGIV
ncbi:MAG: helix-turn-helix domain-containing protein [Dehalococcoidia bacterium]